jgi:hypothetical protein
VDLRGWTAGAPLHPLDALAGFLPALGVPVAEVPDEVARAAACTAACWPATGC